MLLFDLLFVIETVIHDKTKAELENPTPLLINYTFFFLLPLYST
jgi:hypothetical protein